MTAQHWGTISRKRRRHIMRQNNRASEVSYSKWIDFCVSSCKCQHPFPCPCDAALCGGLCDELGHEPDVSEDEDYDL